MLLYRYLIASLWPMLVYGLASHRIMMNTLSYMKASHHPTIIPVLHDIPPSEHVINIISSSITSYPFCSVSLRNPHALNTYASLRSQLTSVGSSCKLGVSTVVAVSQIDYVRDKHISFISTTCFSHAITIYANRYGIPMLCGVSSLNEAADALSYGVQGLKFYPTDKVSSTQIYDIKNRLLDRGLLDDSIPVIVAGGVTPAMMNAYYQAGADGFTVGVSCSNIQSSSQLSAKLEPYNSYQLSSY